MGKSSGFGPDMDSLLGKEEKLVCSVTVEGSSWKELLGYTTSTSSTELESRVMTVRGVVGGNVGGLVVVLRLLEKFEGEVILTIWVGRGTDGL